MRRGRWRPRSSGTRAAEAAGAAARPARRIVLVGNPNVGKSALFNALTGLRATVSNYPGTTVEVYRGRLAGDGAEVVDSPGLNSLLPLSEDEQVTWDLVRSVRGEEGAVVVQVADAKNLRRALLLTLQLGQLEVPTVLVLNMHDEAEARGIRVDVRGLEAALGIPVRTTVATRGLGIEGVTAALAAARAPRNHLPLPEDVAGPALALLTGREAPPAAPPAFLARYHEALLAHADAITRRHATDGGARGAHLSRRLGRLAVHPVWGWPILAAVLWALYEFVGVFGAGTLVDLVEEGLFHGYLNPWAIALFAHVPWAFARDLFVGEYGLVTMGLSYGLAIVLPIVATFFTAFALLEDSGYLPRLAVMSDRVFRRHGAERQGRPPDGARARLRHHGHPHHPHPADPQGARPRDAAPRPRRALLGPARRHPRHAGRGALLRRRDLVRARWPGSWSPSGGSRRASFPASAATS